MINRYFLFSIILSVTIHTFFLGIPFNQSKVETINIGNIQVTFKSAPKSNPKQTGTIKTKSRSQLKKNRTSTPQKETKLLAPIANNHVEPEYPYRSRLLKEEGDVLLEITINSSGEVSGVSIIKSSGFHRLDNAAMEAVKKTSFDPKSPKNFELAFNFQITERAK